MQFLAFSKIENSHGGTLSKNRQKAIEHSGGAILKVFPELAEVLEKVC